MVIKVLLADDHSMIRKSVRSICREEAGIAELTEVTTCLAVLRALKTGGYTHLILDITLQDGSSLTILPMIFENYPNLRILIYSSQPDEFHGEPLHARFGVQYLSKEVDEMETLVQIVKFLTSAKISSPSRTNTIEKGDKEHPFAILAPREREILYHLMGGASPKEIADLIDITPETVRSTKKRILIKLGAKTIVDVLHIAARIPAKK